MPKCSSENKISGAPVQQRRHNPGLTQCRVHKLWWTWQCTGCCKGATGVWRHSFFSTFWEPYKAGAQDPRGSIWLTVALSIDFGASWKYYHFLCEPRPGKACTLLRAWSSELNMKSDTTWDMRMMRMTLLSSPWIVLNNQKRETNIALFKNYHHSACAYTTSCPYTITLLPGKERKYLTFMDSVFFKNSNCVLLL